MTGSIRSAILTEGYVGLEQQGLGLAERAGWVARPCRVTPRRPWGAFPARLWPRPLHRIDGLDLAPNELVIAVGGTAAVLAAAHRRCAGGPVVQVQHPRVPIDRFDVVVANRHDELTGPNVVVTRTALHRITPSALEAARTEWRGRLGEDARPLVAVLIGGANGRFRLGAPEAGALGTALAALARRERIALALTPSRRTAPTALAALRAALAPVGALIWDGAGANPYRGLLALAEQIVVTCDSISMVSEAAATTAAVSVVPLPGRSRRIGRFLATLAGAGRIRLFDGALDLEPRAPLDDTDEAVAATRLRLGL